MNTIQRAVWKSGQLQWLLAVGFVLSAFYLPRAAAEKDSPPSPLWEIDLSKYEYQGRPRKLEEMSYWRDRQHLVFTRENVLATTFQTHIENSGPSVRDKTLPTDPNHIVALFLDAGRGEVIQKGDWPTKTADRTWFFAGQDGQFIVGIGDTLRLYSPDLSVVTERRLPASYGNFLEVMPSPAADTFLVLYIGGPEIKYAWKLDLLDTTRLSALGSWTGEQAHPPWELWGNEVARFSEHELSIETPQSGPKKVRTPIETYCGGSFVNQDTLAVGRFERGKCDTVLLVWKEGNIVQELHFDSKGSTGLAHASRNGKFFAINGYTSQRIPWKPYVKVFKLGNEKPLLIIDLPPAFEGKEVSFRTMGDPRTEWGGVALSPEGELLAVRAGPIVSVYRVPQPSQ